MLALERKVSGRDAKLEGTVRIAATEALATTFLIPRLARLRAARPELDFTVVTSNLPSALVRGEADLALRLVKPDGEGLVIRRVGTIELGVFAARSYLAARGMPKLDGGLAGHDVLGYHSELASGTEARWLAAHAANARMVLRVNSVLNLLAATLSGMGIAVLPVGSETTRRSSRSLSANHRRAAPCRSCSRGRRAERKTKPSSTTSSRMQKTRARSHAVDRIDKRTYIDALASRSARARGPARDSAASDALDVDAIRRHDPSSMGASPSSDHPRA